MLVIEDDGPIRQGLADCLDSSGYGALLAARGDEGLRLALSAECDLVLLDLMLPGMNGMDVLRELRAARPTLPVIILTARGEERDRVQGLKLGADDYVVKPFSRAELLARIEAVLRRTPERPLALRELNLPGVSIDLDTRRIAFEDGTADELSEREAQVLAYMARNPGRVVSRTELMSRVWGLDPDGLGSSRAIDMNILRLREKLRDPCADRRGGAVLQTVRGKGYLFTPPAPEGAS